MTRPVISRYIAHRQHFIVSRYCATPNGMNSYKPAALLLPRLTRS